MKTRERTNTVLDIPMKDRGVTDYHFLFSKGIPKEERERMTIGDLWINGAVCLKCKDFIRSRNGHDFRWCSCKSVAVDGGSWYARRVGEPSDYISIIEEFTDV